MAPLLVCKEQKEILGSFEIEILLILFFIIYWAQLGFSSEINIIESQKSSSIYPGHITSPAADKHTINTSAARGNLGAEIDVLLTEFSVKRTQAGIKPRTLCWWTQRISNFFSKDFKTKDHSTRWWFNIGVYLCSVCSQVEPVIKLSTRTDWYDCSSSSWLLTPGTAFLTTSPECVFLFVLLRGNVKNK